MTGGDGCSGALPRALVALGGSVWKKLQPLQAERSASREPPGRITSIVEQQIGSTFSHLTGIAEDDGWWARLCAWAGSAYVQTDFFRSDARKEWLEDRVTREGIRALVGAGLVNQTGDRQALSRAAQRYAHYTGEHPKIGEDAIQLVVGVVLAALLAPLDGFDRSLLAAIQSGTEHLAGLIEALDEKLDRLAAGKERQDRSSRVPMQIANPVADFQGREDALAKVIEGLCREGGSAISAIHGMGGIGKTELAKLVAEKLRDLTTGGQIHVDLLGTSDDPQNDVKAMAEVVRVFDPTASEPRSDAEAISAYHHALQGKRVLLLLDNASNGSQVKRLIDHKPDSCLVLVTSRQTISLPGLAALPLSVLSKQEARALLRSEVAAQRANDAQLDHISERCGYLPLALRAAGRFLVEYEDWPIAGYLADLSDEKRRLARLNVEDDANLNVAAVLSLSARQLYRDKPHTAARWQQLAVFKGDFDEKAAAAVWSVAAEDARETLAELRRRSMVLWEQQHDRYHLHDLMRDVARLTSEDGDPALVEARLEEAAARHAQHYCGVLAAADQLYMKSGENILAGLALYDLEQRNIAAGQAWAVERVEISDGAARLAAEYADSGHYVLSLRLAPRIQIGWLEAQLNACRRLSDRRGEAAALGNLGHVCRDLGETRQAIEQFAQVLTIAREIGDQRYEGNALRGLGNAYFSLGETWRAIECYEEGLAIAREIGDQRGVANALGNLGNIYYRLGEPRRAIELYEQNLAIECAAGNRRGEGTALNNLGLTYADLGELRLAIEHFLQTLAIAREIGDRRSEGQALGNLGIAYRRLGEARQAIKHFEQHLEIACERGDREGEGNAHGNLGIAYAELGEGRRAIQHFEQSLKIAREIGDQNGEGNALGSLGNIYRVLGEPRRAVEYFEQGLAIVRATGNRRGEGTALNNLGLTYADLGELRRAIRHFEQSLKIARETDDREGCGTALANLGMAYGILGDARRAIQHFEQSLKIARDIGDVRGQAQSLFNSAVAFDQLGERFEAIRQMAEALRIYEQIEDPSREDARAKLAEWRGEGGA